MHPLKQYLTEIREPVQDFAVRIGASRQTLYRIINGVQAPKPALARRIVEASGGAVTLDMLYRGEDDAEVVALNAGGEERLLDHQRMKLAIAVVVNHIQQDGFVLSPSAMDVAAEAAINTYGALAAITTRQGPARLAQALRPVLEEILTENGEPVLSSALDQGADLAAQLYLQADGQKHTL